MALIKSLPIKANFLFLIAGLFVAQLNAQTITVTVKASLPTILIESSGVECNNRNKIWSHNDSGGNPEIYEFDSTGYLMRTLQIANATNVDWEEIRQDSEGNYYACDFGNNNNDRQDLKIYKIPNPDSIIGNSVNAQVISFSYPDQTAFPPPNDQQNFDMEACIIHNHTIYMFSKDRSSPYNGHTKLYTIPDSAGTYIAHLIDSFYVGPGPLDSSSITSADLSPNDSTLVLITHQMLFLFSDFIVPHFFSGTVRSYTMSGTFTKKEGVVFTSNTRLYITDEKNGSIGRKLYDCDLGQYLIVSSVQNTDNYKIKIYPNPSAGIFVLEGTESGAIGSMKVYNQLGEVVFTILHSETNQQVIDLSSFPSGLYIVRINRGEKQFIGRILRE